MSAPTLEAVGEVDLPERPRRRPVPGRLASLDGLRFVAALSVVFFHYVGFSPESGNPGWGRPAEAVFPHLSAAAKYGWLGVELFFMISGFVICMSAWDRRLSGFFVSRVVRLYPAYWFAVLATTAVVTIWPTVRHHLRPSDVLVNLTMLQSPLDVPDVDGVYWTLWTEFRFYLLFAIVVRLGLQYRRVVLFCLLWTIAAAVAPTVDSEVFDLVVIPTYAPFFIAGIACYLMHRYGPDALLWGIIGVSWLLAQHGLIGLNEEQADTVGKHLGWWPTALIVTGVFAVVILIAVGGLSWMRWRWLTLAGATTYPLYLLHEYIGWTVVRGLADRFPPLLVVSVTVVAMVLLAWLVHRWVERPVARLLRRWLSASVARLGATSSGRTGAPTESA
ncbi:acyltransferase family protein [Planosporangium sp. 12N6]|uniref:acyltransferase family protein n=1 Tax=Planosporangium spinosum TaxID=3402278 RepID=UPI003CEDA407